MNARIFLCVTFLLVESEVCVRVCVCVLIMTLTNLFKSRDNTEESQAPQTSILQTVSVFVFALVCVCVL